MRTIAKIALIASASLLVAGCAGTTSDPGSADAERVLTIAQSADVSTLDPQNASETPAERVNRNVYSRLFTRMPDNEIVPELATSYERVDDTTWVFELRDDAVFSNGDPVTAADVQYSLNRVTTDETLLEQSRWSQIVGVEATGEYEITISTEGPMPTLLNLLSKSGGDVLPSAWIEENGIDAFIQHPFGSGPYQIDQWITGDRVILSPNPHYYGDQAEWDEVIVRAIPENASRVSELITGGVDLITDVAPIEWSRLEGDDSVKLVNGTSSRTMLLIVRLTDGYSTADPRVREAIDYAIDDGEIAETLLPDGAAVPVLSRVTEGVFGSNPDLYDTYNFDLEHAQDLVEEVTAETGAPVEVTLTAPRGRYTLDAEVAEVITSMMEAAGITVNLQILEGTAFTDVYANHTNDELLLIGLADGMLDAAYSMNHYQQARAAGQTDYFNEQVEEMLYQASRELDTDKRERLYQEAAEIVANDRPHITLFQLNPTYGLAADIDWQPTLDEALVFNDVSLAD